MALRAAHEDGLVVGARDAWVVQEVAAGPRTGQSGQADWYDWLDDNQPTINATFASGFSAAPTPDMVLTVSRLVGYWEDRMHTLDALRWLELAARAPDVGEFVAAAADAAFGSALALNQQSDAARPHLETAMAVLACPDADRAIDAADLLVFMAAAAWAGDDWSLAARAAAAARAVGERSADPHAVCAARAVGAAAELLLGRPEQAVTDAQKVLTCAAETGNDVATLFAAVTLGVAALLAGNPDEGLRWTGEILRCQLRLGVRNVGDTLEQRGTHYARAEQPLDALRCYAAAQTHQVRVGRSWPRHPGTGEILADLQGSVDAHDYDRAWRSGLRLGMDELSAELA